MHDLLARIKAEKWDMMLFYSPNQEDFLCLIGGKEKMATGRNESHEVAIVEAIREMDRC